VEALAGSTRTARRGDTASRQVRTSKISRQARTSQLISHAVEVNLYARHFVIMALLTACIVAGVMLTSVVPATAQSAASSPLGTAEPTPEQVKTLLQLLSDPVVKGWIAREMQVASAPQAQTPGVAASEASVAGFVEWRLQVWQEHLRGLADALPGLSAEIGSALARMWAELTGRGLAGTGLLLAAFIALSFGAEWLFSWATARLRSRVESVRPASVAERIRLVLSRFLLELVRVLCFAGGSIGAFLIFTWPPQLRRLVLGYLFAFLILRVTLALCHFLFAPAHAPAVAKGPQLPRYARDWSWFSSRRRIPKPQAPNHIYLTFVDHSSTPVRMITCHECRRGGQAAVCDSFRHVDLKPRRYSISSPKNVSCWLSRAGAM
jgi:hypothetical protein